MRKEQLDALDELYRRESDKDAGKRKKRRLFNVRSMAAAYRGRRQGALFAIIIRRLPSKR